MADLSSSSGRRPVAKPKKRRSRKRSQRREWQQLQPELLCHALRDDDDAALRRAVRAVCRDWRGTVDSRLITQLCCDIDELPRLGKFLNLRHVVVEGAAVRMRGRQSMQQRLWAHARLSSKGPNRDVNQKLPRLEALPASRGNLSPLAALPGVQAVTLRCLPLLTANFLQQAAHLTHLTSLTLHNPLGERGVQMLQLPEALSALTQLKALTLIRVSDLARKALLGPAAPLGTPAAAGHSHPPPSSSKAPTGSRAQPATSVPCPWLAGLQHLAIRHSDLPDLRPALASLTSCTHLDLSHCSFKHGLPPSLGQLTQLKVLDLGYCSSRRLPKSCWPRLTALTRLSLSGTSLQGYRQVPLKQLPSLQHVELRDQRPRIKALLGCNALQVLDIRGSQVTRIAADALLTALSQQPALKKVLYSIRVHQMVRVHPDVEWVVDPRWTPNSRIPVGDWWGVSDEQEGERSFLFSNSSEDTDSDSTTTSSSSSESSSGRESSDVVSVSSSDGGREHDVGGAFSEDESTERSEEDSEEDSESESDMDSDTESESSTEEL